MPTAATWSGSSAPTSTAATTSIGRTSCPRRSFAGWQLPPDFTVFNGTPLTLGCSVWGCIAYDETLKRLYCPTGNGVPDGSAPDTRLVERPAGARCRDRRLQGVLPGPGGKQLSRQRHRRRRRRLADAVRPRRPARGRLGCKNGSFHVLDADTLAPIMWRQLLPIMAKGPPTRSRSKPSTGIPTRSRRKDRNPRVANRTSDDPANEAENYSGIYSTAAVHPPQPQDLRRHRRQQLPHGRARHRHRHDAVHARARLRHA